MPRTRTHTPAGIIIGGHLSKPTRSRLFFLLLFLRSPGRVRSFVRSLLDPRVCQGCLCLFLSVWLAGWLSTLSVCLSVACACACVSSRLSRLSVCLSALRISHTNLVQTPTVAGPPDRAPFWGCPLLLGCWFSDLLLEFALRNSSLAAC
jgi:hypothetical protein